MIIGPVVVRPPGPDDEVDGGPVTSVDFPEDFVGALDPHPGRVQLVDQLRRRAEHGRILRPTDAVGEVAQRVRDDQQDTAGAPQSSSVPR